MSLPVFPAIHDKDLERGVPGAPGSVRLPVHKSLYFILPRIR
jgi:hypothetical protein